MFFKSKKTYQKKISSKRYHHIKIFHFNINLTIFQEYSFPQKPLWNEKKKIVDDGTCAQ